jgi:hypothetical protein
MNRSTLAYHLNNTEQPSLLRAVQRWESLRPRTVTLAAAGTPDLRYRGYPAGQLNILRLAADLRDHASERVELQPTTDLDRADILLHGLHERDAARLPTDGPLLLCPFRVHLVVDTPDNDYLLEHLSKREMTERRRHEREADWQLHRSTDAGQLARFYQTMYTPTMEQRHGEAQRTESVEAARAILKRGALYSLHRDGEWVAGALCTEQRGVLTTRLLGVADGAEAQYQGGVLKMLYFLLLQDAASGNRFHQVDLYGTEAMLAKGIFQWKRRLGAYPVMPRTHWSWKRLVWELRRDTPQVRDYLNASPLLVMAGQSFQPTYFFDDLRPVRQQISSKCPTLPPPTLRHLDDLLAGVPRLNMEEANRG